MYFERAIVSESLYQKNGCSDPVINSEIKNQRIDSSKYELILRKGAIVSTTDTRPVNYHFCKVTTPDNTEILAPFESLDWITLEEEIERMVIRIRRVLKDKQEAFVKEYINSEIDFYDDLEVYISMTDAEIRNDYKRRMF